jgi:hypothetical protein
LLIPNTDENKRQFTGSPPECSAREKGKGAAPEGAVGAPQPTPGFLARVRRRVLVFAVLFSVLWLGVLLVGAFWNQERSDRELLRIFLLWAGGHILIWLAATMLARRTPRPGGRGGRGLLLIMGLSLLFFYCFVWWTFLSVSFTGRKMRLQTALSTYAQTLPNLPDDPAGRPGGKVIVVTGKDVSDEGKGLLISDLRVDTVLNYQLPPELRAQNPAEVGTIVWLPTPAPIPGRSSGEKMYPGRPRDGHPEDENWGEYVYVVVIDWTHRTIVRRQKLPGIMANGGPSDRTRPKAAQLVELLQDLSQGNAADGPPPE